MYILDFKVIIAYSSVAHIGIILRVFNRFRVFSSTPAFGIIIRHAFRSCGLFYAAIVIYNFTNSRSILINKGDLNIIPQFSVFFCICLICNIRAPPRLNFVIEVVSISCLVNLDIYINFLFFFITFFAGLFNILIFSSSQLNKVSSKRIFIRSINPRSFNFLHLCSIVPIYMVVFRSIF